MQPQSPEQERLGKPEPSGCGWVLPGVAQQVSKLPPHSLAPCPAPEAPLMAMKVSLALGENIQLGPLAHSHTL